MKKLLLTLAILVPLMAYASVPLSHQNVSSRSNTSGLTDGFYHLRNAVTGRYISFNDTDPGNYPVSASGDVNMGGIRTYINYDSVAVSPSCVIYIKSLGDGKYDLIGQASSLYTMTKQKMPLNFIANDDGSYKISVTIQGATKFLSDGDPSDEDSWLTNSLTETQDWYLIPIDTSDEYIAVRPDVKTADGQYYGTIYASFNFRLASEGMAAYYVSNAGGTGFTMNQIEGDVIPGGTPVIIRCNSANIEDNKIEPVIGGYTFDHTNWLGGVYFSISVAKHRNMTLFDKITMRLLGLSENGELAFVSEAPAGRLYKDQYLMANRAYLKVNAGDADVMTNGGYSVIGKVTLTAKNYSREYGELNPSFDYTKKGGDINGKPSIICDATETSPVGNYAIKITKGDITDSNVQYVDGILTITKAPLTITANSYIREEGEANPSFEVTYNGFKNNETESVLTKKPIVTTSATSNSKPGVYDISVSGAEAQNYSFKYINGTLTVTGNNNVSLTVESTGAGSVSSEGWTVRNGSKVIDVVDGTSVTISLLPDDGYRIKSVWLNNKDVTSDVSNNQYTLNSIKVNTTVKVEFEAIPPTTYTLTLKASGNGSVTYNGTSARNNTQILTLNEGISAKVVFSPDDGYRIKSAKMNGREIGDLSTMSFTIDIMDEDVIIEVVFEAIPSSEPTQKSGECGENVYYSYDSSTHTLTIYGEGSMWNKDVGEVDNYPWWSLSDDIQHIVIEFGVTSIGELAFSNCKGLTSITLPESLSYVDEHAFVGCENLAAVYISNLEEYLKIHFSNNNSNPLSIAHHLFLNGKEIIDLVIPDGIKYIEDYAFINGSSLKTVYIPNSVTFIGVDAFLGCSALTSVTIPSSVTSIGFGAFYGCSGLKTVISEIENPFTIDNNVFYGIPSDAQLIVPKGTKAKYQATAGWNQFTNIMEAGEEPDPSGQIHKDDIYFKVIGSGEAEVVSVEEGEKIVSIPSTISHNNTTYKVTSISKEVFENREYLAAVIWEPEAQFNAEVSNPNFLLYVKDEKYASRNVKNVVVNNVAESIELSDASGGNDFYCPRSFTARKISYSHHYNMETGLGDSKGWETIVLPFDVQSYTHATKGEIEPFTTWTMGSNKKPFWLFELTADGYKDVAGIKANTPYIISMPNNRQYEQQYQIPGVVTFSATNVEVKKSDDLKPVSYQGKTFVPNYANKAGDDVLALNVNSYYVPNPGKETDGSKFIRGLRAVHPFEAYMTTTDGTRSIDVMDDMATDIKGIGIVKNGGNDVKVYDIRGVMLKTSSSMDEVRKGLKAGVYIVNGKKMIIK